MLCGFAYLAKFLLAGSQALTIVSVESLGRASMMLEDPRLVRTPRTLPRRPWVPFNCMISIQYIFKPDINCLKLKMYHNLLVAEDFSIYIYIYIIASCRWHGYLWPSFASSPYRSSPPAGLLDYISYSRIAAVCMFDLVIRHPAFARPYVGVHIYIYIYIYIYTIYIYIYILSISYIYVICSGRTIKVHFVGKEFC